jgi:hypothetical protein
MRLTVTGERRVVTRPLRIVTEAYLDRPTLDGAEALLAYWDRLRPPGGIPCRADIDPFAIRSLLPNISIVESVAGGADWRFRLIGSAVIYRHGFDATGRCMSRTLGPEGLAAMQGEYRRAIRLCEPSTMRSRYFCARRDDFGVERVLLPIVGRDGVTPWMMFGTFFVG